MKNDSRIMRLIGAAALGSIAVSILLAMLTIVGEEYAPLKIYLKDTFTHHWLGKSALSLAIFVLITLIAMVTPLSRSQHLVRTVYAAAITAVLSSLAMTLYFVLHTLHIV